MKGSRAGDVDPGILLQLLRTGTTIEALEEILNRRSGLVALAGTADFRAHFGRRLGRESQGPV